MTNEINKEKQIQDAIQKFQFAATVVALIALFWPALLSIISENKNNPYVVLPFSAIILLLVLSSVQPIVNGLWAFIAKSKVPFFSKIFYDSFSHENIFTNIGRIFAFAVPAVFFGAVIGIGAQQLVEAGNILSTEVTKNLPVAAMAMVILIYTWMLSREVSNVNSPQK